MEVEGKSKKLPGNRSTSQRKKSSRSKCRVNGRKNTSSVSRRRKNKNQAKLVNQNSIDNVHCFPISFADFFCVCRKDRGKEKNKIKRISSKKLSKISKTANPLLQKIGEEEKQRVKFLEIEQKESNDVKILEIEQTESEVQVLEQKEDKECPDLKGNSSTLFKEEKCPKVASDPFAVIKEPLDFDQLKLNGNLKNLITNVKLTSILDCANVPRTLSQIKLLLDNHPSLKTQLKHILGDNLKNENMKPVAELLASDRENSVDKLSNDSSIRHLAISKSVMETKNHCFAESVNSSFILSKKEVVTKREEESAVRKRDSNAHLKSTRKKGNSHSNGSESQMNLFGKIFSSVFRPAKPIKNKNKKLGSRDYVKRTHRKLKPLDSYTDDEKLKEIREKYDEWYKMTPENVRERFQWEDYARVTLYLNSIREASSCNDEKVKEMLNLWIQKFHKQINQCSNLSETPSECHILVKKQTLVENIVPGKKLKRIMSDEMLNKGDGDVIHRLNSLMKELLRNSEFSNERLHGDASGDSDECSPQETELPGCSKCFDRSVINMPEEKGKGSTNDEVSIYQAMCASFLDKLSKHGSKESKSIVGSRYTTEMPWQNKDFQVFYVPTIQTKFTLDSLMNRGANRYDSLEINSNDESANSLNATEGSESLMMVNKESLASLKTSETKTASFETEHLKSDLSEIYDNNDENEDIDRPHTCNKHSNKKVSFEENISQVSSIEKNNQNDFRSDDHKDFSTSDKDQSKEHINLKSANDSEVQTESKVSSIDLRTIIATCPSDDVDLSFILDIFSKEGLQGVCCESIEYIKNHKCELVKILRHLLSFMSQNYTTFQSSDCKLDISCNKVKACVGVQCKISEDDTKQNSASLGMSTRKPSLTNFKNLLKSQSETNPRMVGSQSESDFSDDVKLLSSLSDSGVHSSSSTLTHRREFISLPDVLDGAPIVSTGNVTSLDEASQNSLASNLASSLSTSISCQASQTPVDDFSLESASDLSYNQCRVLKTRSSTAFQKVAEMASPSENSLSSKNTRSCPEMQESKATKNRIKNIFRRINVKKAKK